MDRYQSIHEKPAMNYSKGVITFEQLKTELKHGGFKCDGCDEIYSNDYHGVSFQGGGTYCEFCQAKGD